MESKSKHNCVEGMLQDECSEPRVLPFDELLRITNDFSDDRILGRGTFGVVYKGVLSNGALVAVKLLFSATIKENKFENEVQNLFKVRHQNIVRFFGYSYETWRVHREYAGKHTFAEMPQWSLCFEYVPKNSLDRYISDESQGLDWSIRHEIIKGICCGLHYLHENCQIVHMDLKPANILLDENMVPKIADFGMSKIIDDINNRTGRQTIEGSFGYMAPEYLYEGTITPKVDLYSFGMIMIQMLAGCIVSPAYDVKWSIEHFVRQVLENWRMRLDVSPSCTSPNIAYQQIEICLEIGLRCLEKNPTERPTIREIFDELDISGQNCSSLPQIRGGPEKSILSGLRHFTAQKRSQRSVQATDIKSSEKDMILGMYPLLNPEKQWHKLTQGAISLDHAELPGSGVTPRAATRANLAAALTGMRIGSVFGYCELPE
ncbi:hypothetical protein EJB05_57355, partial [Eragrostis curvula]